MVKLVYKPLSVLIGVAGGVMASAAFKQVWKLIADEEDPPTATQSEYGWREVLVAAALQGAIFGLVKAAIDRGGAEGFRKLTGTWPGD
jgi:Protein of unknown function (DUF4235)